MSTLIKAAVALLVCVTGIVLFLLGIDAESVEKGNHALKWLGLLVWAAGCIWIFINAYRSNPSGHGRNSGLF